MSQFKCAECGHLHDNVTKFCGGCGGEFEEISDKGVVKPADMKRLTGLIKKAGAVIVNGQKVEGKVTPTGKFFKGVAGGKSVEVEISKVKSYVLKSGVPVLSMSDGAALLDGTLQKVAAYLAKGPENFRSLTPMKRSVKLSGLGVDVSVQNSLISKIDAARLQGAVWKENGTSAKKWEAWLVKNLGKNFFS